jgi:hypothetical protein
MTTDEELAMDLALEALEKSTDNFPANVQHRKAITAIKQARALDKKAENARELGLDYEPVFCEYCGGNDDADFGLPTDHCTDCARPQPAAQPAPVQVSPLDFVTMVMEREHLVGKPLFWAEWPNKENT